MSTDMNKIEFARIKKHLGADLDIIKEFKRKNTIRACRKFLCTINNNTFLLLIPTSSEEYFYLLRSIKKQKEFIKYNERFKINQPDFEWFSNNFKNSFVINKYYSQVSYCNDYKPIKYLLDIYEKHSYESQVNDELVEKIITEFLSAWPTQCHHVIKLLPEYEKYITTIKSYKSLKVCFEHGDFTTNNILQVKNKVHLIDFEFARNEQPIGFDIYDYCSSINQVRKYIEKIPYYNLHKIKYDLINRINSILDRKDYNTLTLDYFSSELDRQWTNLYKKGGNYNLSPTWCKEWISHYGTDAKLNIFTAWEQGELVLLAPFYSMQGEKTLRLIGANPDLYDQFSFLSKNSKYHSKLIQYMVKSDFKFEINYLNTSESFSKILFKTILGKKVPYDSHIIDTKPYTKSLIFKSKEKTDINRCLNRVKHRYHDSLKFDINIKKDNERLAEFINMHINKWEGGPFKELNNFKKFIKTIYNKSEDTYLSRLYLYESNETVAYHFGYYDSKKIFWSSIPTYNIKYSDISPGKILLSMLIPEVFKMGAIKFDFGRGAEEYKYWFSNEDDLLIYLQFPIVKSKSYLFKKYINKLKC